MTRESFESIIPYPVVKRSQWAEVFLKGATYLSSDVHGGGNQRMCHLRGVLSEPRQRRRREHNGQTKGLMRETTAVCVRFESLYIFAPSSAKQHHTYFGKRVPKWLIFLVYFLELNDVIIYLA